MTQIIKKLPCGVIKRAIKTLVASLLITSSAAVSALEGSAFELPLISQNNATQTLSVFKGKLLILNFIFTHCPSACPIQTANLRKVQKVIEDKGLKGIQLVSLSIDPARDTPSRMLDYANNLSADLSNWQFFTGDAANLKAIADSFDAAAIAIEGSDELEHKLRIFILSPSLNILQIYGGSNFDIQRVISDIEGFHQAYFANAKPE